MNDTVARIVEIMFQDTVMTEEVAAIRDEVMNNCQERYEDMLAHGMNEDDAIAAVIESLKGMEEVISQYPKKEQYAQGSEAAYEADETQSETVELGVYAYEASEVNAIDVTLVSEDVYIDRSDDDMVHVTVDCDGDSNVRVALTGGRLRIDRVEHGQRRRNRRSNGSVNVHMSGNNGEKDSTDDLRWEDIGSLEQLGKKLGNLFRGIRFELGGTVDRVTICLPDGFDKPLNLMTTSGDIDLTDVSCTSLRAVSTSGDVNVHMTEESFMNHAEIVSTSGDVEATIFGESATVRTTSGDLEVEGRIALLNVQSVSGDIDVRADVVNCTFKSVSGDVDAVFDSDELRVVNGSTMSGDIDVTLPSGVGAMQITTRSMSGDVTTHCNSSSYGHAVNGSISSMSGDIDIR